MGKDVKLSWSEAERIVRKFRRASGLQGGVSAAQLADTLGISQDELLALRDKESSNLGQARFADRSALWSAIATTVLLLVVVVFTVVR